MLKKLVCVLLCLAVLIVTMGGFEVAHAQTDFSIIRVLLSTTSATSYNLTVDGNYSLNGTALARGTYTAKIESSNLRLYQGSTRLASVTPAT